MYLRRLVKQCQNGDREAFGILYQTYLFPMRKVVAYYVDNQEAVWDILHDGFLIAFDSINSLKNAAKLEAWLTSIMKNLALQYLKKESISLPISSADISIPDNPDNNCQQSSSLSWEELNNIINRLPEGYGKVFRLALLDGLSHKEIGTLLGIAPHSSSSQLAHAKAKMRVLITRYKAEIGVLSVIAIMISIWHGLVKNNDPSTPKHIISNTEDKISRPAMTPVSDKRAYPATIIPKKGGIYRNMCPQLHENIANETVTDKHEPTIDIDSIAIDTVRKIPNIFERDEFIAEDASPLPKSVDSHDWSFSLAYSGSLGERNSSSYLTPNSNDPNSNTPPEIEVTEKTHHHIPLVIGMSINKTLNSRWSIETGLRYTFLRSDIQSQSMIANKETTQRIHYIGIPIKFNYRIINYNGFSVYGQGGVGIDIPVYGKQSIWEIPVNPHNATKKDVFHIHPPVQWSIDGGFGLQYHFTSSFGIYAEPSLRYYFNPGAEIKTIRQDKPLEFIVPIGLRLTW